jgi:hypothetical protein
MKAYFLKKKFMILRPTNNKNKELTKKLLKELGKKPRLKERIKIYRYLEITIICLRYTDNNYKTGNLHYKEN